MLKLNVIPLRLFKESIVMRSIVLLVLLALEFMLISLRFDAQPIQTLSHPLLHLLGYSGEFLRFSIAILGAFVIFSASHPKAIFSVFTQYNQHPSWLKWFLAHASFIVLFYLLTYFLFNDIPNGIIDDRALVNLIIVSWLLAGISALIMCLLSIAPLPCWLQFIRLQHKKLMASILAGGLIWIFGQFSEQAWQSLAKPTFWLSFYTLRIFYSDVVFDVSRKLLGTQSFHVTISPQCSGFEGIGLIVAFLSIYIWITRKELRFPQVYFLFPLGIITIWLLNSLRIVILIAIGTSLSPEIAIGGFHSNAGWISFVIIGVSLVLLCQKIPLFNKRQIIDCNLSPGDTTSATALLLPFVILLATLLLTSAVTASFDWLYPLRVILAIATLWQFRKQYQVYLKNITGTSCATGFVVFIIWILLVPASSSADNKFATELFSVSPVFVSTWLLFRFVGATITVPIIEELAFRGYLIAKLVNTHFETVKQGQFTWFSFFTSSLLFGLLHGEWFAGTVAGLFYAFALYKRGELLDSVVAHMTTNVLLAIYVVSTSHWSLW